MSKNFELIWPQVRSPEAVWWPYLRKVCNHARARVFDRSISSLQDLVRVPVCAICISRNFDIGDLRSGQFRDLPIISQWGKNQLPVFTPKTGLNGPIYHTWLHIRSTFTALRSVLLLGSCKVMWRHQRSPAVFANNSVQEQDTDAWMVSLCSARQDASNDIHDDLEVTWPEVNLWPWPFEVNIYIIRCGLTRGSRWCP